MKYQILKKSNFYPFFYYCLTLISRSCLDYLSRQSPMVKTRFVLVLSTVHRTYLGFVHAVLSTLRGLCTEMCCTMLCFNFAWIYLHI